MGMRVGVSVSVRRYNKHIIQETPDAGAPPSHQGVRFIRHYGI